MKKIDINKLPDAEINRLAKLLADTNTAIWNAVCLAEKLSLNPVIKAINPYEHQEFLKRLMDKFRSLNKNDDEFVDAELNARILIT